MPPTDQGSSGTPAADHGVSSHDERISPENERRILDVDYVLARLHRLFPAEQAHAWLRSLNAHLGAINAEEQGATPETTPDSIASIPITLGCRQLLKLT